MLSSNLIWRADRHPFESGFFGFRLGLLCISEQGAIYVCQPFFQQLELINQKNHGSLVMIFFSAGYRALSQLNQFLRPLRSLQNDPGPLGLHSSQGQGLTPDYTLRGGSLPQYCSGQLGERVCENLGELRKTHQHLLVNPVLRRGQIFYQPLPLTHQTSPRLSFRVRVESLQPALVYSGELGDVIGIGPRQFDPDEGSDLQSARFGQD